MVIDGLQIVEALLYELRQENLSIHFRPPFAISLNFSANISSDIFQKISNCLAQEHLSVHHNLTITFFQREIFNCVLYPTKTSSGQNPDTWMPNIFNSTD